MTTVVIKSSNRAQITQAVQSYVKQLRQDFPDIIRIVWFGSWVSGYPSPGSDVDLCLIIPSSGQPARDRVSAYLPVGFPVGIDLFVYTQAEFEELGRRSPGWQQEILKGIDL